MAILKAPLFSFDARGQVAKSLVFMGWKGLKTVRQHVDPSNPKTPAQTTNRTLFTDAVASWRDFIRNDLTQTAWNSLALVDPRPLSGFNAFMTNAMLATAVDPASSFFTEVFTPTFNAFFADMVNLDDGAGGTEAGDFSLFSGLEANSLQFVQTKTITGGALTFTASQFAGTPAFYEIVKDGQSRSGLVKFLVT